ncbi:hypothetical protein LINGRAHAP2_LOCUS17981 [Linum grandiflorum]
MTSLVYSSLIMFLLACVATLVVPFIFLRRMT